MIWLGPRCSQNVCSPEFRCFHCSPLQVVMVKVESHRDTFSWFFVQTLFFNSHSKSRFNILFLLSSSAMALRDPFPIEKFENDDTFGCKLGKLVACPLSVDRMFRKSTNCVGQRSLWEAFKKSHVKFKKAAKVSPWPNVSARFPRLRY